MTLRSVLLSIVLVSSLGGIAETQELPPTTPLTYLQAALAALQQGEIDETQRDLEQARTQLLAVHAKDDPATVRITLALKALAEKNRGECARRIEDAMKWMVPGAASGWPLRARRD